jgi:hypothetical protein
MASNRVSLGETFKGRAPTSQSHVLPRSLMIKISALDVRAAPIQATITNPVQITRRRILVITTSSDTESDLTKQVKKFHAIATLGEFSLAV